MTSAPIALVTGGSQGIGLAIARRLAREGHAIALCARTASRLEAAIDALDAPATLAVPADLRDPGAPAAVVEQVTARLGAIDLLVNNAGTAPSGRIQATTDEMLEEVLDLHVKAPFRLIRALLGGMQERGRGCVIQLASTAGLRGFPRIAGYAAAKHGMVGLTRALAAELGDGPVRTYAVCPGFVDTAITRDAAAAIARSGVHSADEILQTYAGMNACGRLLQPEEIAATVAELADPSCPHPSGSLAVLDEMPPRIVEPSR